MPDYQPYSAILPGELVLWMAGNHARGACYSMSDLRVCAGIIATTSFHTAAPDMNLGEMQPTMML